MFFFVFRRNYSLKNRSGRYEYRSAEFGKLRTRYARNLGDGRRYRESATKSEDLLCILSYDLLSTHFVNTSSDCSAWRAGSQVWQSPESCLRTFNNRNDGFLMSRKLKLLGAIKQSSEPLAWRLNLYTYKLSRVIEVITLLRSKPYKAKLQLYRCNSTEHFRVSKEIWYFAYL